ncbi:MAG TPA: hypothetical protein VGT82_03505, partial [Ktedonobacteraceae bacterium]|nr:hypothetical protein [Ktedonobacteraceae bacterium]
TPRPPGELNSAISPAVEAVILKALEKDPAERYQQAEELAEAYWNALGIDPGELKDNAQLTGSEPELRLQKNEKMVGTPSAVTQVVTVAETLPRAAKLRRFPLKAPAPPLRSSRKKKLLVALPICLVLILGSALSLTHFWQPHDTTLQTRARNATATPLYQATATAQAQQVQATLAAQSRVQATAGITNAIGAGDVLYADAMTTPGGGWVNDGSQCYFSSDGYHVYSALAHAVAWCYSGQRTFANTIITAQAVLLRGDLYGLIFRLSPFSKSFYVLEINSQGDYRFVLAQGSNPLNWLTLIDWTHSSAIAIGYGQTNTFLVMATGKHFRFYINKQLIVSSFSDSTYASGMIGFLAGGDSNGGTEATFSNIWVFQK